MDETGTSLWNEIAARANVALDESQHRQLEKFLDLLAEANERINLTRISSREEARVRHIGDALTLLPFLPARAFRLADVGSGGGVPGIPLAIARPDVNVSLIESTKKKAGFLREVVDVLRLPNVQVIDRRAEEVGAVGRPTRESFDIVIARAVATMPWLVEWCLPLTKIGGTMLAMKGPRAREELAEANRSIKILGGREPRVHPVQLPGTDAQLIVEIHKTRPTDARFPRDPTVAKGKSLSER